MKLVNWAEHYFWCPNPIHRPRDSIEARFIWQKEHVLEFCINMTYLLSYSGYISTEIVNRNMSINSLGISVSVVPQFIKYANDTVVSNSEAKSGTIGQHKLPTSSWPYKRNTSAITDNLWWADLFFVSSVTCSRHMMHKSNPYLSTELNYFSNVHSTQQILLESAAS